MVAEKTNPELELVGTIRAATNADHGADEFYEILHKAAQIHSNRNHDYAHDDPFDNFTKCGDIIKCPNCNSSIGAEVVFLVFRLTKMLREINLLTKKEVKSESIEDSQIDEGVYSFLSAAYKRWVKNAKSKARRK